MKLYLLLKKVKPLQRFVCTDDLNKNGWYYIEESSPTVRYVAYDGCPASTIPLNVDMIFSDGWELKGD